MLFAFGCLMTLKRRKSHFINGRINGCLRDPDNPFVCGKKNRTIKLRKQCRVEVVKQSINGRKNVPPLTFLACYRHFNKDS
jgi:hypothetical protein